MRKGKSVSSLIAIALIFLCNPNVNVIDVLPDLVAYLLLLKAISGATDLVPYMAECRVAIKRLAVLSAVKIPAALVMLLNLHTGRDIIPMFTTVFAALEAIFIFSAVTNAFKALYYLGERGDAVSLIKPFRVGRSSQKDPDSLLTLSLVFFMAKSILGVIPELCLLTFGDVSTVTAANRAYPFLLAGCVLVVTVLGIIWVVNALAYKRAASVSDDVSSAIMSLATDERLAEIERSEKIKSVLSALSLLLVSTLLTFNVVIESISDANVLPKLIYAILISASILKLTSCAKLKKAIKALTLTVSVFSAALFVFEVRFFDRFTHLDLGGNATANAAYLPIKLLNIAEAAAIIALLVLSAISFAKFIKEQTGIPPHSEGYSRADADNHKRLIARSIPIFATPMLISIIKCTDVFLRALTEISIKDSAVGIVSYAPLPWLGTLSTVISVVLAIYTYYTVSELKSEVKMKYSDVRLDDERFI